MDAEAFLTTVEHAKGTGAYVDPAHGRITFEEWARRWMATTINLRPSTRERDIGYLERYVLPHFGQWQLAEIDYLAITEWVSDLSNRRLAPATITKAAQILGKILKTAVQARRIASNPCAGVEMPKVERKEMRFLTPSELATLAETIDQRFRGVVLLGGYGGLRAGEIFGLRASRVDLLRNSVDVAEIVVEVGGHQHFGSPKTRAGRRVVPIPRVVTDELGRQLAAINAGPRDFVFPAPDGGAVRLASWRSRYWNPAVTASGVSPFRIHDLRHTAVSLWLAAGADPVEVARRAGHTSTAIVLDRYGHVQPRRQDLVTGALDDMATAAVTRPDGAIRRLKPR